MGCSNSLKDIWPDDLYFVVPASGGEYINPDETTINLPSRFANWKLRIWRNNGRLDYEDQGNGDPYWTHNEGNNQAVLNVAVEQYEKFIIEAYKPLTD